MSKTVLDGSLASPQLAQLSPNHGIDSVLVAPDDTLFVSIGDDTTPNGDLTSLRAQDTNQPYGKVLHLTPDGAGVPSNPFYSAAQPISWRSRIYSYGLRNPFRFTLDPRSGAPYVADVGWIHHRGDQRPRRRVPTAAGPATRGPPDHVLVAGRVPVAVRRRLGAACRCGAIPTRAPGHRSPPACSTPARPTRRCTATPSSSATTSAASSGRMVTDADGRLTRVPEADGFAERRRRSGGLPPRSQRRRHLCGHPQRPGAPDRLQRGEPASRRQLHDVLRSDDPHRELLGRRLLRPRPRRADLQLGLRGRRQRAGRHDHAHLRHRRPRSGDADGDRPARRH